MISLNNTRKRIENEKEFDKWDESAIKFPRENHWGRNGMVTNNKYVGSYSNDKTIKQTKTKKSRNFVL